MTAPTTPSLGPAGEQPVGRRRGGSVGGGPWQLIEVSNAKTAAVRSTPASPIIPLLRTPPIKPQAAPIVFTESEDEADLPSRAVGQGPDDWDVEADARPRVGSDKEDGFDASFLAGDWRDNLGHKILVVPSGHPRGMQRRRSSGGYAGGGERITFLATLSKPGVPDKRFNITSDRGKDDWTCGNGTLVREESSFETLTWRADDGRMSTWSRAPPEGPVYFDAPPPDVAYMPPEGPVYFDAPPMDPTLAQPQGPPVYFDPPPGSSKEDHSGCGTVNLPPWVQTPPGSEPPQ